MKSSLKAFLSLAFGASALVSTSTFAGNCGTGSHGDYYNITGTAKGTTVKVSVSGVGGVTLTDKQLAQLTQTMELTSDCKFTSVISGVLPGGTNPLPIFTLTGSWSYPEQSKVIYFTLDGDISKGSTDAGTNGTWGSLFNADPGAITAIPNFYPILLNPLGSFDPEANTYTSKAKLTSPMTVVYPSVSLQKGYITLSRDGQTATITTLIGGNAVAHSPKTDKSKLAKFSLGATAKATVSTDEPLP